MIEFSAFFELLSNLQTKPQQVFLDAFESVAEKHDRKFLKVLPPDTSLTSVHRADLTHTVVGAASILAKTCRDESVRELESSEGRTIGSGYPSDVVTKRFLESCGGKFPDYVRKSWKTISEGRFKA